jgi:hypothetical protein
VKFKEYVRILEVGELHMPALDYELDTELVNRFNKQTVLLIIGVTYILVLSSTERCNNFFCRSCYASDDITRIKHEQRKDLLTLRLLFAYFTCQ